MPGWSQAGRLTSTAIPGGITNLNFRVDVDGESFVVRIAGRDTELLGIDREAEYRAAEAAAAVGTGPEVVAFLPKLGSLVTRFVEGGPVPEEAMREPDTLGLVVPAIRAFHEGPALPSTFSPFRIVETYEATAAERGVDIPEVVRVLRDRAREIEEALGGFTPLPCHNDLLNANFIRRGDRVYIVDYEYAGMGDRFFDLANLSVNHSFDDEADRALLERYFGDVAPEQEARLKLMRIMSDYREGMWGVIQQGLSSLDFDYVEYADRHLDRCRRSSEDPRYDAWVRGTAG
jgi:thiamine kinase-like enzyme